MTSSSNITGSYASPGRLPIEQYTQSFLSTPPTSNLIVLSLLSLRKLRRSLLITCLLYLFLLGPTQTSHSDATVGIAFQSWPYSIVRPGFVLVQLFNHHYPLCKRQAVVEVLEHLHFELDICFIRATDTARCMARVAVLQAKIADSYVGEAT